MIEQARNSETFVKTENYNTDIFRQMLRTVINNYSPEHLKAVTFNNDSEFVDLFQMTRTTVYFANILNLETRIHIEWIIYMLPNLY